MAMRSVNSSFRPAGGAPWHSSARRPPFRRRSAWRSELRAQPRLTPELREQHFRNWLDPVRNEDAPHPVPGQKLSVRFLTRAEKEIIRQEVVIGLEPYQAILLIPKK